MLFELWSTEFVVVVGQTNNNIFVVVSQQFILAVLKKGVNSGAEKRCKHVGLYDFL